MAINLERALDATVSELPSPSGQLALYHAGSGAPLLLLHSVNAVASAAEVRPLFDHYRASRCVYALDLPGFGLSERRAQTYTVRHMHDAIVCAAQWISARHDGAALNAMALSLTSEFLARAALTQPTLFQSLTLVSPTGFNSRANLSGAAGTTRYKPLLDKFLRGPGWGNFLFRQLTRPAVIRYFLRRTWGGPKIDEQLWAYCCQSAKQPNAEFAPLSFLSGILFSGDIHKIYQSLTLPILLLHGVRGDFNDYGGLGIVRQRSNWQIHVLPTGALPYFEVLPAFIALQDAFLAQLPKSAVVG